jgi:hypothetical protein
VAENACQVLLTVSVASDPQVMGYSVSLVRHVAMVSVVLPALSVAKAQQDPQMCAVRAMSAVTGFAWPTALVALRLALRAWSSAVEHACLDLTTVSAVLDLQVMAFSA